MIDAGRRELATHVRRLELCCALTMAPMTASCGLARRGMVEAARAAHE
jgi:hypothetical protein